MARQPNQSRNLSAALGRPEASGTVLAVWLLGISLGALVLVLIVGFDMFGNAAQVPGQQAAADFNDVKQANPQQLDTEAAEGQRIFAQKCGSCHAGGGRVAGIGPSLARSHNARDMSYIHGIVRQGACGPNNSVCGMPNFWKTEEEANKKPAFNGSVNFISDTDLYKVITYLRSIQQAPRGAVAPNYVPPTLPAPTARPAS